MVFYASVRPVTSLFVCLRVLIRWSFFLVIARRFRMLVSLEWPRVQGYPSPLLLGRPMDAVNLTTASTMPFDIKLQSPIVLAVSLNVQHSYPVASLPRGPRAEDFQGDETGGWCARWGWWGGFSLPPPASPPSAYTGASLARQDIKWSRACKLSHNCVEAPYWYPLQSLHCCQLFSNNCWTTVHHS